MHIIDWYGADWRDINGVGIKRNAESLKAFFWLQHFYYHQPFKTEIIYITGDEL